MSDDALIARALSAAPPELAAGATVLGADMQVLREGDNGYTCMAMPEAMCNDAAWMEWAQAWVGKDMSYAGGKFGISYMLAGDQGASNIDPWATEETADNQWVVEGPHLMILLPDRAALKGLSTDPESGGPYVMWAGTPFAHLMVPVNIEALPKD